MRLTLVFLGLLSMLLMAGCASSPQKTAGTDSGAKPGPVAVPPVRDPYSTEFWRHWSDGAAELSGFELTAMRYGKARQGTAVTIFVTEPFAESNRVKADPGHHESSDEFPVLKLNLVRDYHTGIYDYNEMLSVFMGLKPSGGRSFGYPAKVSFSAQEWCGHLYTQLLPTEGGISGTAHSYFDGEADQISRIEEPVNAVYEDTVLLWARGQSAPFLTPGQTARTKMLNSLFTARGDLDKLKWLDVILERGSKQETITVPAGRFSAVRQTVRSGDMILWSVWTEAGAPYRLVRWENSLGESARLTGSARLKYWELNAPGGEKELSKLGIRARLPRMM